MSSELLAARDDPKNEGNLYKAKFDRYLEKTYEEKDWEKQVQDKVNDQIANLFIQKKVTHDDIKKE